MWRFVICLSLVAGLSGIASAQLTNGSALVFHSNGEVDGAAWTLGNNVIGGGDNSGNGVSSNGDGYVGTYIQVPSGGGQVTFNISASGVESNSLWPDMTLSVAGENTSFSVNSATPNTYTATVNLPGDPNSDANSMYAVRVQLDNQTATAVPDLTVNSLTVSGATVVNSSTDALALDAAQTYIDNFRSGAATLNLTTAAGTPMPANTPVHIQLASNNFNFTDAVSGINTGSPNSTGNPAWMVANPAPGSYAYEFQHAILNNFNAIVPSNAGKWSSNEPTQGNLTQLTFLDGFAQFAQQNGLKMRMHNLIWDNQQPTFVTSLFTTIAGGGSAGATAQATLSTDIQNRINYWLDGTNTLTNNVRAQNYAEADILNEAFHGGGSSSNYWGVYGAAGVANIYNEAAAAVKAAGANTRLYTNEFNVLQNSQNPLTSGPSDAYADWYLAEVQDIRNAGGAVGGIGVEDYVASGGSGNSLYSISRIEEAMQNLSVAGLPISLTEFGASGGASFTAAQASSIMTQTMTMVYGTPQATTMGFWGDLGGPNVTGPFVLYDTNWNLTTVGQAYEAWQAQYNTNLNLTTGANGQINFNGTYGTYLVTVDGQNYNLTFSPGGQTTFTLARTAVNGSLTAAGGGSWNAGANWTGGVVPQFAGDSATLGNVNSGPSTVTLDGAQSVASLTFDSANSYTVTPGSGGSLVLDAGASMAVVTDALGTHTIAAPVVLNSNTIVNVNNPGDSLTFSGNIGGAGGLTLTGAGNVTLSGSNSYAGHTSVTGVATIGSAGGLPSTTTLSIGATTSQGSLLSTGKVTLAPNIGIATVAGLNFTGGGSVDSVGSVLDITNNSVAINYGVGNPSPAATIRAEIISGMTAGGDGSHGQILSSTAASNVGFAVGYADGSVDGGTDVPAGQLRIEYTLIGDANLDGSVNLTDLLALLNNYGQSGADWAAGDFNYDNSVNLTDLLALLNNYGQSTGIANTSFSGHDTQVVPEPATMSLLALGAGLSLRRRNPKRRVNR